MKKSLFGTAFLATSLIPFFSYAINNLTVNIPPDEFHSKPGYIDEAILVVEPHGGYIEESLYLYYSDHGQYSNSSTVQINHKFELPIGSVINDMWLWVGTDIMKAIMMDVWTARSVYDSIVGTKKDPAFLSKQGEQYELRIFPLKSGSYRKVKINFITPSKWYDSLAIATLPLKLLNSSNSSTKPIKILFRVQEDIWGEPTIDQFPNLIFEDLTDTLGYEYKYAFINDTKNKTELTLRFKSNFHNGYFAQAVTYDFRPSYFQLGIKPMEFFELNSSKPPTKYFIGLDLSGIVKQDLNKLEDNITALLSQMMQPEDRYRFYISGAKQVISFANDWSKNETGTIDAIFRDFSISDLYKDINSYTLPNIVFCDNLAEKTWIFNEIKQLCNYSTTNSLLAAVQNLSNVSTIATYSHAFHTTLTDETRDSIIDLLVPFFEAGGRVLCFYDYNRVGKENFASHYIPGLTTEKKVSGYLYRVQDGNIAEYFPESVYHSVINLLSFNPDPNIKAELVDNQGQPAVISKRIGNGILIVSGIWTWGDDNDLRKTLNIPLLGLSATSKQHRYSLDTLLNAALELHKYDSYDKAIFLSNSDSLITQSAAEDFVQRYNESFNNNFPQIHSVNLASKDNPIPSIKIAGQGYYGSGYFLKVLADVFNGLYYSIDYSDWESIRKGIAQSYLPVRLGIDIAISGDYGEEAQIYMREIDPTPANMLNPIFYIGSTRNREHIDINVTGAFMNVPQPIVRNLSINVKRGSDTNMTIIPTMLAFEQLKDMIAQPRFDTSEVINLAMEYNLLCDYTALLALEPNDTIHPLENPKDESPFSIDDKDLNLIKVDVRPNPFVSQTQVYLELVAPMYIEANIFNIKGQLVSNLLSMQLKKENFIIPIECNPDHPKIQQAGIFFLSIKSYDKLDSHPNEQFIKLVKL